MKRGVLHYGAIERGGGQYMIAPVRLSLGDGTHLSPMGMTTSNENDGNNHG